MRLSNLPPGVTESMIPGNRPEDREVECVICLSVGEIEMLQDWRDRETRLMQQLTPHELYNTIDGILDQINESEKEMFNAR